MGIANIETITTLSGDGVFLYLSYNDLLANGVKIGAVNSVMRLGETQWTVYSFESNAALADGTVNLIHSTAYEAERYSAVFSSRSYSVASASEKREDVSGLIVQMSENDYAELFESDITGANQAVLYFSSDTAAKCALSSLPEGMIGMLSTSTVYVQNAGDIYASNVLYYIALIAVCLLFAALISIIFGRSVKIYQADFAVYRTLGIPSKVSARSLYIQMLLIFLPTLVLLPIVSLIASIIPGSALPFISAGNYIFIELMMLIMVEVVAFGFNKGLRGMSIRKSLKRGSK